MRKVSVVVIALAAAGFGAGASAQEGIVTGLTKDPGMARSFAPQQPAQLGSANRSAFSASPAAATERVAERSLPAGAMTSPTAPGSGTSITFASTPDIAQGMSAGGFSKSEQEPGTFSTASAEPNPMAPTGLPQLLGVDLSTGATTSFGAGMPSARVKLGQ